MADRLVAAGYPLDLETIRRDVGEGVWGRPHLARALVKAGHAASNDDATRCNSITASANSPSVNDPKSTSNKASTAAATPFTATIASTTASAPAPDLIPPFSPRGVTMTDPRMGQPLSGSSV